MKNSPNSKLLLPSWQEVRTERARRHLIPFTEYTTPTYRASPVHHFMAAQLEAVERVEVQRMMLFLPPRTGKTELLIHFVAWCLGRNPDWQIIYTAYGADLAWEKSGEARAVVDSDEFGEIFGARPGTAAVQLDPLSRAVQRWRIKGRRGSVTAQGVGGPITGKGGRLIIVDDPVKNREEADSATMREKVWRWYTSTLRTRLEPHGLIIVVMTRWHDDDLAGRLLSQAKKDPVADQWHVVSLPAIATEQDVLKREPGHALDPVRFDEATLAATRASIGPRDWAALYQQDPQPEGGSVFQGTWFRREDASFDRNLASQVVQAWDTAFKAGQENDYSACVTLGQFGNQVHVLNVWRGRVGFPELLSQMKRQADLWHPNVIVVEDKGSGTSALQELRSTSLPVVPVQAERDKVARANLITGMAETGRVSVPATRWGDDLIDELVRFPAGAHDDQVDALVYGLMRLRSKPFKIGWA